MEGIIIVTLALVIPVILFPAAFVWYLNISGIVHAVREAKATKKAATAAKTTS